MLSRLRGVFERQVATPDEVRIELARTLYAGMPAMLAICIAVLVSSIGIGLHLGDPVFLWIAMASATTSTARISLYVAYRRRSHIPLTAARADRMTRAYGIVSVAFAAVLATLVSYGLRQHDVLSAFVIGDLVILYSAQSARASTRPWIGLTCGFFMSSAFVVGIMSDGSVIGIALGAFLALFYLAFARSVMVYQRSLMQRLDAQRDVEFMARHDSLTGLYNRAHFAVLLDEAIARAARGGQMMALHFIDLDRFKLVNDTHGHEHGDQLLRAIADHLVAVHGAGAPGGCLATRIGGDEFVVLQTQADSDIAAAAFADTLCRELAEVGARHQVTASIGMAIYPNDGTSAEELMRNADVALYEAKAAGRATFRGYDVAAAERLREHQMLVHDLRETVANKGFTLVYQPQARTYDGATVGYEALVRWAHPTFGPIGPDRFIPMAEEAGVIGPLGAWVLETACRDAAGWDASLAVAVNLSPVQIVTGDLPALVRDVLARTGLDATRLELEITEGIFIEDTERTLAVLTAIKAMGVRIAMDDFGTGYSSLSYLQAFPFDRIKIDRSFVSNLEHSKHSRAIVRAVTSLGKGLGIPVLAEGVETEEQRALLLQEGCGEIQGYLLSRPAPIESFDTAGRGAEAPVAEVAPERLAG